MNLDVLREGWTFEPFSFLLLFTGLGLSVLGTVMAILGVVSLVAGNESLARRLTDPAAFWILPIGVGLILFGLAGWWVVGAVAALAAFGYAVRPRTKPQP